MELINPRIRVYLLRGIYLEQVRRGVCVERDLRVPYERTSPHQCPHCDRTMPAIARLAARLNKPHGFLTHITQTFISFTFYELYDSFQLVYI